MDTNYQRYCQEVYDKLLQEKEIDDQNVKKIISWVLSKDKDAENLDLIERSSLEERIFNRFRRLDILQPLLDRDEVTEIMVNGPDSIFFESYGQLQRSPEKFQSAEDLQNIVSSFFAKHNVPLSNSHPMNSLRLADGSRANAVLAPISKNDTTLTIRKFSGIKPSLDSLIENNFMRIEEANFLIQAVQNKKAIIIGGGTGTGKTTLLNVLSAYIPVTERIITIEDSPELQLQNRDNWVQLCTREKTPDGSIAITAIDLIKNALRMRPDRIIVGEVRGDEAYDMLQAAMSGHPGTLCTVHGNDCFSILHRTADLILSRSKLQYEMILKQLANAFDIIVHIERQADGKRKIKELCELHLDLEKTYRLEKVEL